MELGRRSLGSFRAAAQSLAFLEDVGLRFNLKSSFLLVVENRPAAESDLALPVDVEHLD